MLAQKPHFFNIFLQISTNFYTDGLIEGMSTIEEKYLIKSVLNQKADVHYFCEPESVPKIGFKCGALAIFTVYLYFSAIVLYNPPNNIQPYAGTFYMGMEAFEHRK
jgi:hypothetical protein